MCGVGDSIGSARRPSTSVSTEPAIAAKRSRGKLRRVRMLMGKVPNVSRNTGVMYRLPTKPELVAGLSEGVSDDARVGGVAESPARMMMETARKLTAYPMKGRSASS